MQFSSVITVCNVVFLCSARHSVVPIFPLLLLYFFVDAFHVVCLVVLIARAHTHTDTKLSSFSIPVLLCSFFFLSFGRLSGLVFHLYIHGGKGHLEWNTSHHNDDTEGDRKAAVAATGAPTSTFVLFHFFFCSQRKFSTSFFLFFITG